MNIPVSIQNEILQYCSTKKHIKFNFSTAMHYATPIFTLRGNIAMLNNDGHFSVTTQKHINFFLRVFGFPQQIIRNNFQWKVINNPETEVFHNGMFVTRSN
jgi:hypothetical protein